MDLIHWAMLITGWLVAATWAYFLLRVVRYSHSQPTLHAVQPGRTDDPQVCVIVPACNESETIEACLRSLLAQDYHPLHIVAINDRSTDDTGAIMDKVACADDRLTVLHVDDLPGGWLGKNHANWRGAMHAVAHDCAYLLFTDGDVIFEPDCLGRAVRTAHAINAGLLCLTPRLMPGGFLESAMCHFFGLCYLLKTRPWHLADRRRDDAFIGFGAFNLVKRREYEAAGGHEALRLEVLDDYKLGKLLKVSGARCAMFDGGGLIRVRWQVGLTGVVRGLEKNAMAGCDYSLWKVALSLLLILTGMVAPMVLAFVCAGAARWGWTGAALLQIGLLAWCTRLGGAAWWGAVTFPLCAATLAWALARSTVITLARGGVTWRGTFYPLRELRRGLV